METSGGCVQLSSFVQARSPLLLAFVIILSFGSYCCFPFFVNPGLIGEEIPPTCTLNSHVDETLVHVHVGCMQQSTKYDPSYSAGPQEVCFKPQI